MTDRPDAAKVRDNATVLDSTIDQPRLDPWRRHQAADLLAFLADALEGKGDWQVVPKEFIEFVKNAPVSSGLCMCGVPENHGFSDHPPVEMWAYHLSGWLKQIAAAKERDNG